MEVRIEHPTDRPNFSIVHLGSYLAIGFSYSTPVAFWRPGGLVLDDMDEHEPLKRVEGGWVVRENDWGSTTGKHLNYFDEGDKSERVSSAHFEARLATAIPVAVHVEERLG